MRKLFLLGASILLLAGCKEDVPESFDDKINGSVEKFFSTSNYREASYEMIGYERVDVPIDFINEYKILKESLNGFIELYENLKGHIEGGETEEHYSISTPWRCDGHDDQDHDVMLAEYELIIASLDKDMKQIESFYTNENYLARCMMKKQAKCTPVKFYINSNAVIISYEIEHENASACSD